MNPITSNAALNNMAHAEVKEIIGDISSEAARKEVFWGLKENWWKQIYDGKFHIFGKNVFDKGLHGGQVEPGFYASAKKGCDFAASAIGQKLDASFYVNLNEICCSHFYSVDRSMVNCDADKIGKFRDINCFCTKDMYEYALEDSYICSLIEGIKNVEANQSEIEQALELIGIINDLFARPPIVEKDETMLSGFKYVSKDRRMKFFVNTANDEMTEQKTERPYCKVIEMVHQRKENIILKQVESKVQQLNQHIENLALCLNVKPFAVFKRHDQRVICTYAVLANDKVKECVNIVFDLYHEALQQSNSPDETLKAVAALFQNLEWLHPFFDGQGRTDLILLSRLLVENGFTPAILEDPYFSSFHTLDEWIVYLKAGMEKWEIERASCLAK